MSSPRPKVNPPLCGICMSSVDVRQEPDGGWHCRKQRCFRQRTYKPIMVTEIEKGEPASLGLFNRLWTSLTRDIDDDRRPKHPRPEFPGGLRSPKDTGAPRPKPPQDAPATLADLHRAWSKKLNAHEWKLVVAVMNEPGMTPGELATATNYSGGGRFNKLLASIRSLGLVTSRGPIEPTDLVYPDGLK